MIAMLATNSATNDTKTLVIDHWYKQLQNYIWDSYSSPSERLLACSLSLTKYPLTCLNYNSVSQD